MVEPSVIKAPRNVSEIEASNILGFDANLSKDHPGFEDAAFKRRRWEIACLARSFKPGEPIPRLEYQPKEKQCWRTVLGELKQLYPTHACREFLDNLAVHNFKEDEIPQLEDVSKVLRSRTGWKIHPVAGLLHPRDFLNALAFKTFHSTQYVRHPSQPQYTPEPDVLHELLGHTVMLANEAYANLVQAIGEASLHADEKQLWHLTKIYWYTVEFGVVREGNTIKAFGAGLLSSYGELTHMRSGEAWLKDFDPFTAQPKMSYKDGFQKGYFVLDSFERGAEQLMDYCKSISPN